MTSPPAPPPSPSPPAESLSTNFSNWNAPKTVAYTRKFVAKVKGHPSFPEPWADWAAPTDRLTQKSDALEAADHDAGSRDKFKVAHRNFLNSDLKIDLASSVRHVNAVAQGNGELLRSLDLIMRKLPGKKKEPPPMVAPVFSATQSKKMTGVFDCKAAKCAGAVFVELWSTDGDPSVEANWVKVDNYWRQLFQAGGFTAGKTYSLRARCVGPNGYSPFSPIVTLISL